MTYILLMFFNSLMKVMFLNEACDAQVDLTRTLAAAIASIREQANVGRRFFLRYLFHEVRVPLNSVLLGLTLLSTKGTADATEREAIEMMTESANFMADTLNDVLEMNEIEEGHMKLVKEPFSMFSLLTRAQKSLAGLAATNLVAMRLNVADDTPDFIQGDRLRLEHVIVSLLDHAIKNSPLEAVVAITVLCRFGEPEEPSNVRNLSFSSKTSKIADEPKKNYCITIAYSGVSISATEQNNLFIPFQQLRPEQMQRAQGTGLGLSLARDIIELHGGTLTCKASMGGLKAAGVNMNGTGNLFCIELPYEPVPEDQLNLRPRQTRSGQFSPSEMLLCTSEILPSNNDDNQERGEQGSTRGSAQGDGKSLHCLIVDDTVSNRKMLALVLSKREIESSMAEDGYQAVQMVRECSQGLFDVIFMDNTMPIMTGVEATAALRSTEIAYPNLIIGVTGNALDDDVTAFLKAGADMVLAKPMRPLHLQQLMAYITSHGKRSNPRFKLSMGANGVIRIPVEPYEQQHQEQPRIRPAQNV